MSSGSNVELSSWSSANVYEAGDIRNHNSHVIILVSVWLLTWAYLSRPPDSEVLAVTSPNVLTEVQPHARRNHQ